MFGALQAQTILNETQHRPWPLPERPWIISQSWHDLLFAHWPVDVGELLPHIPDNLDLDAYQGKAWIGVIPFWMSAVKPRMFPALPWLSTFPEINVRTYVKFDKKPGVFFFSLDAGNPVAVSVARRMFHLPYFRAAMKCQNRSEEIAYSSQRIHRGVPGAEFQCRYSADGEPKRSLPGTLEYWLTERYCLYANDARGVLYRCNIHHLPWALRPAQAEIQNNTMTEALEIELKGAPLLHYTKRMDVLIWPLEKLTQPVYADVLAETPV